MKYESQERRRGGDTVVVNFVMGYSVALSTRFFLSQKTLFPIDQLTNTKHPF